MYYINTHVGVMHGKNGNSNGGGSTG
jgi:hypothetical protein